MMLVKFFFFLNKLANICWTSLTHYTLKGNSYFCESANVPSPVDIIAPNVNVCTRGQYCVCVKMWISLLLNQLELKFKVCIKTRVPWNPTIHGNECFLPSCGQTDLMWRGGETPRNRQSDRTRCSSTARWMNALSWSSLVWFNLHIFSILGNRKNWVH